MINDKQSLILCGFIVAGIFITGILDILDNFIILTILTLLFLAVIVNIFYTTLGTAKEEEKDNAQKNSKAATSEF